MMKLHGLPLVFLSLVVPAFAIWPFSPKRFSGNSLLSAGSLGIDGDESIVAFGDFNGDQFLDLLGLASDKQTLTVYLWSHEDYTFKKSSVFKHPYNVRNVVPGDFTQDGRLDLLVMSQHGSSTQLEIQLYIAAPGGPHKAGLHAAPIPPSVLAQPIPMDMNGDLRIDLLGTPSPASANSPFRVWQNVWNASQTTAPVFNLTDPKFNGAQCTMSNPHSNAAIDLNGDCLADIFLVCDEGSSGSKYFQIWVNNKAEGFSLAQVGRLPAGTQQISFADIDRDGTIDMVFPTCSSVAPGTGIGASCYINIAYNKQLPLCASATASSVQNGKQICRRPEQLCTADPDFRFDLSDRSDNDAFVRFPLSDLFPPPQGSSMTPGLLVLDTTQTPPLPVPIKIGDVNQDGFPDLVAIVVTGTGSTTSRTPRLAFSAPCTSGVAGCKSHNNEKRGFTTVKKGTQALKNIVDARSVALFDMDEDGTLDIMVQRTGAQGEGNILFIQNNFYYDAFFLKAIVLNGACGSGLCNEPEGSGKYHPFGVSYSGATYKYTVLDTSGRRSAAEVGQLPQTSYQSLLTPYSYFGLGRTNNYIENLFVGSTKHSEQHYINMEGVVPNSKVVIIPPAEGEDGWKRELYLRPGEWIPWVMVTVIAATIILAAIVFALHLNEKREDELERRKASHHINFDAL
ncbi:integrin alpha N-terminal domain-containing protein [Wolfiporia cocos MD-104 SS10]|uniref:Integrin alpha N-terminal domain-containing protein n=1 Tax=Wolfiporia cocos (strain MD-104) TaxID=742152 RepID=A0A2H3JQV0_WOLCO|nr:integrin alpha N-terminal domain-containing protein [Wolfiporia cocos MD-104 SS10]